MFQWIILLFYVTLVTCDITYNRNNESELIDHILRGYQRQARPLRDPTKPVNVSISFNLGKILDLEERSETLVTYMWQDVIWVDELLQWEPSDFGGIRSVTLLPTQVWLPDFGVYNSAERVYFEDHMKYFRISLFSGGEIQWHPGGIYRTTCALDVTYFPFDSQICSITVQNWEYDGYEQQLQHGDKGIKLSTDYKENGEWKILDSTVCSGILYSKSEGPLGYLKFSLALERKSQYSIINVIVPIVLLSIMDLLVFWLPPESGEKVSLGITVLLSFSVFLLVVDERMPRTSDTVPLLTVYLSAVMATTGLSLFVTVLVLHLHHKTYYRPVPSWLRRVLCIRKEGSKGSHVYGVRLGVSKESSVDPVGGNGDIPQQLGTEYDTQNEEQICSRCSMKDTEDGNFSNDTQWKMAIQTIDHGCFLVFLIIFSLLLLIMLYPYDTLVTFEEGCTL